MSTPPILRSAILPLALAVAGCAAGKGQIPSLAQRPAERDYQAGVIEPPVARPAAGAIDPATARAMATMTAEANRAHGAFAAGAARAAELVKAARGTPADSEQRANADAALAAMASARSETTVPMADCDALLTTTAVAATDGKPDAIAAWPALSALSRQLGAMVDEEDARIAALEQELRS